MSEEEESKSNEQFDALNATQAEIENHIRRSKKKPKLYDKISCSHKGCPVYLNIDNQPLDYYRAIIKHHKLKKHPQKD